MSDKKKTEEIQPHVMTEAEFHKLMNATLQGPLPATELQRLCALTAKLLEDKANLNNKLTPYVVTEEALKERFPAHVKCVDDVFVVLDLYKEALAWQVDNHSCCAGEETTVAALEADKG